jgi:phosphodiesterase/alkaline phosphatase D-like protein
MKVYDLIRANKRSGVIFLTGDVHYAIPTTSACKDAIGGGYKVPEFVSSGLTHTDHSFLPFAP